MIEDPNTIKSPITGGKVTLKWEWRDMVFRKESFKVMFPYFLCQDTGESFTTTESDMVWCRQLYNQYAQKYGIPFTDEIIAIRERYGLSAQKMSLLLGFGDNQWRKYEQGEVPSVSNGRMIRSILNPKVMLEMVESSRQELDEKEYRRISERVRAEIGRGDEHRIEQWEINRVFSGVRCADNGFAPLSLERLKNLMLRILESCSDVWCTKMNKLLFYIDFLAFRNCGMAISGLSYRAIEFGPVPDKWDRVYSEFQEIEQVLKPVGDFEGNLLAATQKADMSMFAEDEIKLIDMVCARFGKCSARELSHISHEEKAWINHKTNSERIPFSDAFELKAI